jgi:decaprenyl-phosphate phosphoribosyltransferase
VFLQITKDLFTLLRAKQWVKNSLLFLPLLTSGTQISVEMFQKGLGGAFFFSIVASFGYMFNDARDRKVDVFHPQKRSRVLASMSFNRKHLSGVFGVLGIFLVALGFVNSLSLLFYLNVLAYFVLTNFYTFYFKRIPVAEMFFVASGFVLRVVAGGSLFGITISSWLLLVTAASSMFLVSLKRLAEFNSSLDSSSKREVLLKYNSHFLNAIPIVFLTIAIMAYCLWAFTHKNSSIYTELSTIPFTFALMQIFLKSEKLEVLGLEDMIMKDASITFSGLILMISVYLGVLVN